MSTTPLQDVPPFAGYDDDQHHPLGGYAALMAAFGAAFGASSPGATTTCPRTAWARGTSR